MRYSKQALSISDQVERLKKRGLVFQDDNYAKKVLSRISYYRLRAYTYPFQDNNDADHPFIRKIDFETIIDLYRFDQKLRILVFDAIEKIEVALRTQIIYNYAVQYGSHWQTKSSLYKRNSFTNREGDRVYFFDVIMSSMNNEIARSKETFIKHYSDNYASPNMPPSWMALEVVSIGTLSKIYKTLNNSPIKKQIAKNFGLKPFILESWMLSFTNVRNICAHHGRLWNTRLVEIELPYNAKNRFFTRTELTNIYPNKVYAILSAINYMLNDISPDFEFVNKLKSLMTDCPLNQQQSMGFTNGWEEHPFWN